MKHKAKIFARVIPVVLAIAIAMTGLPTAFGLFFGDEAEQAVIAINTDAGSVITFSDASILQLDEGVESIVISSLPDPDTGVLKLAGLNVDVGETILVSEIPELVFYPSSNGDISASFSFVPAYADGAALDSVPVYLNLVNSENYPPVAENLEFETYRNIELHGNVKASDPEGDDLVFTLVAGPKKGTVELTEGGTFIYSPAANKKGRDSFTYTAADTRGNTSAIATVTINVKKQTCGISYADMDGSSAGYAALRLAEEGVFIGEQLGDSYFFCPEQAVSRGEFLAMCIGVAKIETISEVSRTGFADDDSMPSWVKPYVTSALKQGIISGICADDGQLVFNSDEPLSFAAAATMLNNILNISDVKTSSLSEAAVEVWAYQATVNLSACNVVNEQYDSELLTSTELTRAEAAELLVSAMDIIAQREAGSSLWSWLK